MFLLHHGRQKVLFKIIYDAFVKTTKRDDFESMKREGLSVDFIQT